MPIIEVKLSGAENAALAGEVAAGISRLTKEVLNKKPEVTVVNVSFLSDQLWFVNSESLASLGQRSFHLLIKITDSTNVKIEKANYIKSVHDLLSQLLVDIHPVSYTAIQEMKADAYGYDGSTIEYKYIRNNTLAETK